MKKDELKPVSFFQRTSTASLCQSALTMEATQVTLAVRGETSPGTAVKLDYRHSRY